MYVCINQLTKHSEHSVHLSTCSTRRSADLSYILSDRVCPSGRTMRRTTTIGYGLELERNALPPAWWLCDSHTHIGTIVVQLKANPNIRAAMGQHDRTDQSEFVRCRCWFTCIYAQHSIRPR